MMVKIRTPISNEHLIAIGKVTIYFALIDYHLSLGIWILIGSGQKMGDIITNKLSFARKKDLFKALYICKTDNNEKLSELDKLVERIKQAGEERNRITHSIWLASEKDISTITRFKSIIKRKTGLEYMLKEMSVEDLEKIAESFGELAWDIASFSGVFDKTDV